jgi:hypothetical protein
VAAILARSATRLLTRSATRLLRRDFVLPDLPKQTVSFVLAEMTRLHHVAVELLGQAEPHTSEIAAALAASRKAELPMVLPMRISQLCSGALGPNS